MPDSPSPLQAVILAGGLGTRMRELYPELPKVLVPLADKPFLEWQLEWLKPASLSQLLVSTGYLADQVEEWVDQHAGKTVISTVEEPRPLGTGGGVKFIEPQIQTDPFMLVNGDTIVPNLDFAALVKLHNEGDALITLVACKIEDAGRYGTVEFDENNRMTAFREKASRDAGWIYGGVYMAQRAALSHIPPETTISMEAEVFPALAGNGLVQVFQAPPPMLDMGTPEGLENMSRFLLSEGLPRP